MDSYFVAGVDIRYLERGSGTPVMVLHGAGVDHREPEACFERVLAPYGGLRRIYPDLPGMGQTAAPETVRSADDVLDVLLGLVDHVAGQGRVLVIGHSAGAYYARAVARRRSAQVAGLALVCPLLPETRDVPPHRVVVGDLRDLGDLGDLGDDAFRSYFVKQTPAMLDRYQRYVAPGAALADPEAMGRIGERWELSPPAVPHPPYDGPTLLVAGRLDSTVGYAATVGLLDDHPAATLAVLDDAGHALPHEQPQLLDALVVSWLDRCHRPGG